MNVFIIKNDEGYFEEAYTLSVAKKLMKEHCARGYKMRIYADGTFVNCGEITMKGSNKSFVTNSMKEPNY